MNEHITTMRRPRVVAHRGASAVAPENTLAAVTAAVARGADAVEVDVQSSRDGVPVIVHDAGLARTTDLRKRRPDRANAPVSAFTYAEIRSLDAGSWFGPAYAGERVPTLEQVLETLRPSGTGLLLELKNPTSNPHLVAQVAEVLGCFSYGVDVTVQSFDGEALRSFGRLVPDVPRALLVRNAPRHPVLEAWASAVNPWHGSVTSAYVRRAQLAGLRTSVWTANSRTAIRRAADAGVDAIITDRPARALSVLHQAASHPGAEARVACRGHRTRTVADAELGQQVGDVVAHRLVAEREGTSDRRVAQTSRHQVQHLELSIGELRERPRPA